MADERRLRHGDNRDVRPRAGTRDPVARAARAPLMSAQTTHESPAQVVLPAVGQWRPVRPNGSRTPKQRKRELRKDRQRRRRIAERAEHDPTLTDFEVRVLKGYLCHSDDSGARVWPKVGTVAGQVHGTVRSVRRCVAQLEAAGYMKRFMRPVSHQRNQSNMYYFCEPPGPIVDHRSNQRRRPRKRRSHRRTRETAGTPYRVEEPPTAGAAKPSPPPHKPRSRPDLLPSPTISHRTIPLPTHSLPKPPTPTPPDSVTHAIADARAVLAALKSKNKRPFGPQTAGRLRRPSL
ncbi:MAG TPA: hypothetical protein VK988_16775 [Acidimicrobiales bacterium]|nr:hypothetical protein [Acidimicrobiales bacterium]